MGSVTRFLESSQMKSTQLGQSLKQAKTVLQIISFSRRYSQNKLLRTVLYPYKKDGERSKGKGHRVSLGGRMYSIPCRASCFAAVDLEEKVEFK